MKRNIFYCVVALAVIGAVFYFQWSPKTTVHESSELRFDIPVRTTTTTLESQPFVAIVPHHLVGAQLTSETLSRVVATHRGPVKRIVLLSPNHFGLGAAKVITSRDSWKTQEGVVSTDAEFVEKIIQAGFAEDDFFVTNHDHGVFNIMPFIKRFFPEARVIPLMLSYNVSKNEATALGDFLATQLGSDDLLVVSADFTHYVSESVMRVHDIGTISALYRLDDHYAQMVMDVDTPQSIVAAMKFAQLRGAEKFVLTGRSSSAIFLKRNEPPDTTSYVSGVFVEGAKVESPRQTTTLYLPTAVRNAPGLALLRRGFMSIEDLPEVKSEFSAEVRNGKLFVYDLNVAVGVVREDQKTTYYIYPIEPDNSGDWHLSLFPRNREKLHEFSVRMKATALQREAIEFERGLSL